MTGAIKARGLGKKYKRYPNAWHRLGEWLTAGRWQRHEEHWAVRDVDFDVAGGEAIGIVGQNGAGKSTLLKLIVGTCEPSEGSFEVNGRATALLELGMGFHPDFDGRQNALMALRMTGFDDHESLAMLPEIESFSELSGFLDQPLRTYSSGMQVRLAFAIATAQRPDILIVDEALSVGDAYFQHKCIRRIREFKQQGTTMLFVSHDPTAVKTLCDRALLLEQGRLILEDSAEAVLDYYNARLAEREKAAGIERRRTDNKRIQTQSGNRLVEITEVVMRDGDNRETHSFECGESAEVVCSLAFAEPTSEYAVGIMIRDRLGNEVFGTNTVLLGVAPIAGEPNTPVTADFQLDLNLGYGHYSITVAVHSPDGHLAKNYHWIDNAFTFQVVPGDASRFAGVARLPASASLKSYAQDRS